MPIPPKEKRFKNLTRILNGVWAASPWNADRMIERAIEVIEDMYLVVQDEKPLKKVVKKK